jgi:hypothetical protein
MIKMKHESPIPNIQSRITLHPGKELRMVSMRFRSRTNKTPSRYAGGPERTLQRKDSVLDFLDGRANNTGSHTSKAICTKTSQIVQKNEVADHDKAAGTSTVADKQN